MHACLSERIACRDGEIERTDDETRNEGENSRVAGLLSMDADRALHHGVLAHEDNGITTEALADVLELLRPHIVGADHQYLRVRIQQLADLGVISDLLLRLSHLHRHCEKEEKLARAGMYQKCEM